MSIETRDQALATATKFRQWSRELATASPSTARIQAILEQAFLELASAIEPGPERVEPPTPIDAGKTTQPPQPVAPATEGGPPPANPTVPTAPSTPSTTVSTEDSGASGQATTGG